MSNIRLKFWSEFCDLPSRWRHINMANY